MRQGKILSAETARSGDRSILREIFNYRYHIGALYVLTFLLHYPKLNAAVIGIDTESLIRDGWAVYEGWLHTGRQGLVFLKEIFGIETFNPYFAAAMTLLTIPAAVSAFFILWDRARGERSGIGVWIFGGLFWIAHPILTEQIYFSLQSFEVVLAMLLTAAALACAMVWVENRKHWWCFGVSAALLLLTFSVYQVMVAFYIFGVVSVLFLQTTRAVAGDGEFRFSDLLRRIGWHLCVFLTAFIINSAVTALFFSESSYLSQQVSWGKMAVGMSVYGILRHIGQVLLGTSQFYSTFYGVFVLCSLLLIVADIRKHKEKNRSCRISLGLMWVALQTTPFLMTIVQGGEPVPRSQLVLPAAMAMQVFQIFLLIRDLRIPARKMRRAVCLAAAAVCLCGGIRSASITWGFYYADQMRYEQDEALGRAVIDRIRQVCGEDDGDLPIVVVGNRPTEKNGSILRGQMIGEASFFCWDTTAEPVPFYSTNRILGFLYTLGADYAPAPPERMGEAMEESAGMPVWPAEESVQIKNGMVIVKLSEG